MSDDLDNLLRTAGGGAPDDFVDQVLRRVAGLPMPVPVPLSPPPSRWLALAQRLALVGAAALGASQVLAFVFGLWAVTAAAAA